MRKYVIFDLDGTLLDSMYIWKEAGALFLKEKGIEAPKDLYEQLKAMSLEQAANYLKQQFHLSLSDAEIIAGIKSVVEKQYTDYVSLKPFVRDYLKRLNDRHIRMCIVTASEYEHAEAALQRLGILDCFDFIVTCSQAGIGKDNPVIFLKVAERWGAQPHEVAVFEDALHAVETAKTAGFFTIGVYDKSAQDDQEEMKRIADLYINDFYEVSL